MIVGADSTNFANYTGVGIGAVLLALVFRTLWRQEGGWRAVLDSSRDDAAAAREQANIAREDAAAARQEAKDARSAERECQRCVIRLEALIADLRDAVSTSSARIDVVERTGEHPVTPPADDTA